MGTAALLALLLAASPSAGAAERAAQAVLSDAKYQREIPRAEAVPDEEPPRAWTLPPFLRPIANALFWLLVAGMGSLIVLWGVRALRRHVKDAELPAAPGAPAAPDLAEVPLDAVEALARAGRFGEAIHLLLLRTLEALSRTLAERLSPAFTSREILQRIALRDLARDALAGLVSAVEVSHFGGSEATQAEYRLCLDRFHQFASAYERAA